MPDSDQLDHDDQALVRKLRQLTVESDHFAEIFREAHGMHRTDLNALAVIMDAAATDRAMSPGELAEALHLSASATTALLDRLDAAELIERVRSRSDGRRVELRMREQAKDLGRQFFLPLSAALSREWAQFDSAERRAVARFLSASIAATVHTRSEMARQS
ncbi:MarR family winged helix-turn-helix transcriptional regulator [Tamaricihabitans halophyticus]|uniref:MarR family winged helix-turn-helix transcriptional regulator n=1 Tax=Tamaricihabitans halophyticus TaxID=1262583 RepID=UPI00104E16B5|nr:MarR family transcriptional regulator [Tamaricihabitans halophyticus]